MTGPLAEAASLLRAGDPLAARSALIDAPESPQRDFLLGACAHALGELPEALRAFSAALQRDPAHAQAACALGSLWAGLGRRAEAEALFRQTLARQDDPQLHFNLGVLREQQGDIPGAQAAYTATLARDPGHYGARHNRAGLAAAQRQWQEAADDYRELIRRHPEVTLPWHNLAELELALGRYAEAQRLLQEVLAREPGNGKAWVSLAVAQAAAGQVAESQASFARLAAVDPARWQEARARVNGRRGNDPGIDPRLIFLLRTHEHLGACDWRHFRRWGETFRAVAVQPSAGELLPLAYPALFAPLDAALQRRLMAAVGAQIERRAQAFRQSPVVGTSSPERLRIGYIGPLLSRHVTGLNLRRFFAAHDAGSTEVFVISTGIGRESAGWDSGIERREGVHWLDLGEMPDAAMAAHIAGLRLDVLVDIATYSNDPRPEVVAARPAPVVVNWLGAPYTGSAGTYDYILSDARTRPGDGWCNEAEVILPGSYFVCSQSETPPVVPAREALGLPAQRFVFANLGTSWKITPPVFAAWMRILRACPESVLWLLANSPAVVLNLKREAEWQGVDPRRLLFCPRIDPVAHLARQGAADLFLDTPFVNGHTTMAESLWAGTPGLAVLGATFAARVGASLLADAGLPELVLPDWARYEAEAIALYHDPARLQALRARLATGRLAMHCVDVAGQARRLERAFRRMHERAVAGLPPASFAVD